MAFNGYLFITGTKQGEIESNLDKDNVEGGIIFYNFKHEIVASDAKSDGVRTSSTPIHGLITVTKDLDETTPSLYKALCTVELLEEVELKWYKFEEGVEELFYSITLENCFLRGIKADQADSREVDNDTLRISEQLTFAYESIRWEYESENDSESYDYNILSAFDKGGNDY